MILDHNETDHFIKHLMQTINQYGNSKKAPTLAAFEPFIVHDLKMTRDINPFCSSLQDFINHIAFLQERLIKYTYHYKKKLLMIDEEEENRTAIYYEIQAAHSEDAKIFCRVSANLLIKAGKIHEWTEILYTTGISTKIFNNS